MPGFPSCLQQNFEFLKSWFWQGRTSIKVNKSWHMSYTFSGFLRVYPCWFCRPDVQDVSIHRDSIAWHPTEHFYPLSSTFLLMAVICVNCYPTQSRTGQTNNVSQCAVSCLFPDLWFRHLGNKWFDLTPGVIYRQPPTQYLTVEVGFCHDLVNKLGIILSIVWSCWS